jgi:hypothetical protein
MIENEEKFHNYFFNKMMLDEKKSFEDELKSSEVLSNEYMDYKKILELVQATKDLEMNVCYSQSVVTNYLERIEKAKRKPYGIKYGYALAAFVIFIFGYIFIVQFNNVKPTDNMSKIISQYTNEDKNILAKQIDFSTKIENQLEDSDFKKIDSLYSEKIDESVKESLTQSDLSKAGYYFSDVDEYLSEKQIELVYSELINKEIL